MPYNPPGGLLTCGAYPCPPSCDLGCPPPANVSTVAAPLIYCYMPQLASIIPFAHYRQLSRHSCSMLNIDPEVAEFWFLTSRWKVKVTLI